MDLVALLSTGKGSWVQVSGLIKTGEWDNILLIGNESARKFEAGKSAEFVSADLEKRMVPLKEELFEKLKGRVKGTEVALSIASGSGKEHMALISALLQVPVGVRFVALTKEGIMFL